MTHAAIRFLAAILAVAFATLPLAAQEADVAGSSDHPAVGRYEGSVITFHETKEYAELKLPKKALEPGDRADPQNWLQDHAGRLTSIRYEGPADRSVLEVMRNYEASLEADGFEISFICANPDECAPGGSVSTFWDGARGGIGMPTTWETSFYLVADRQDASGSVTVALLGVETRATNSRPLTPHIAVTVIESEPMETDRITLVEASEMEQALARDGRIAIYGIYFDFDAAELKPESMPQIDQLGALLNDNPELSVLIVGHTDGKGAFDYNLALSQRRAQSVVDALVSGHGIEAGRLIPAGAGMVAPVATNRTEEGRAKNRRVEIVELIR